MNRQNRYAYELGWAARCLGLPAEIALGPLRETEEVVVMPAPAFRRAVARGYEDAVCECGHTEIEHRPGYGCGEEALDLEGVECPCTGFVSETRRAREWQFKRLRENRHVRLVTDAEFHGDAP